MDQFVNVGLTTATSISVLVIVAVGLAVIFGLMGVINMAHGEFIMVGAFVTLTAVKSGVNFWLAVPLAALSVGAFGLLIERVLVRFLYGRLVETILATWGLALIMVQLVVLIFGTTTQGIPTPLGSLTVGRYSVSQYNLFLILAAILILLGLYVVFKHTRYGLLAQASTQIPEMAAALGINQRRVNMITFSFGCGLAGLAGALIAPVVGVLPYMGQALVGKAFVTVIVGGPAFIMGTAMAAGALGLVDSIVSNLLNTALGAVALLVVAMVLIRFLPTGLSGTLRRGHSL